MNLGLQGHVAIVQGASKGIGRGIAQVLAEEGCDLVLCARTAGPLEAAASEIAAATGRRAVAFPADSADPAQAAAAVDLAERTFGRVDILVCNSGGPPAGGIRDLRPEQWIAAAGLLLAGPVALLQAALPLLQKSPAPRFFVVTSSSTRQPVAGLTLSNTFRPGIVGLVKTMAEELAADRVRCHSIAPGRIDTDRLAHLIRVQSEKFGRTEEEIRAGMIASIPAGRLGDGRDLGNLVAFLASEKADYLTGGNWMVDGGLVKSL